jgi:Acetylglutamate semialdehyde dehydrogenase
MTTSVGIVGFRGYSGSELVQILTRHPHVEPVLLEHRSEFAASTAPRGARSLRQIPCTFDAAREAGIEVVFLATAPEYRSI